MEHPHAGLTHLGLIHGTDASQCCRTIWCWPCCSLLVKKVAQESNEHIITDDATTTSMQHNSYVN